MTEETVIEKKVSEEPKDKGLPQPQFSEEPVSPTSALTPESIAALSQALKPVIEDTIDRKFKSTTDKRFSRLEQGESVMREVLATLKEQGVTLPPALEQQFQMQEYIDKRLSERGVPPSADKSISAEAGIDSGNAVQQIVKELQLDTSDPEVLQLLSGTYRDYNHMFHEAALLVARKLSKPVPSSASSPPIPGGLINQPNEAELIGNYKKEMLAARGKKELARSIQEKYRVLGTPIEEVDLTAP